MRVVIRPEERSDRAAAVEVERLAFASDIEPAIVQEVRDEPGSFALVAEEDAQVIGHVQFSRAWVGETPVTALGPIGVRPDRQGRGIGSALIRAGLEEAARLGEIAAILVGDAAFYPQFGFEPGALFGLRNPFMGLGEGGFTIAEEDFMVAPLDERARSLAGAVRWHPAFGPTGG